MGLIGRGKIGRPIARALLRGQAGPHELCAVLGRSERDLDGVRVTSDPDEFYSSAPELIIEAGSPEAFRLHAARALTGCDLIAVSPLPLADRVLEQELRAIAMRTGHVLRVAPGAIGGLDAIATAMAGELERLDVFVDLAPADGPDQVLLFEGSVRDAAIRFPDEINVAVIAALAGPGMDATQVRITRPPKGTIGRSMGFRVTSKVGTFELISRPRIVPAEDIHTAAASVIALLREDRTGVVVG